MKIFHLDFNHLTLRYDVVHDLLPKIAAMGYNTILWELEGQIAWETCPECATPEAWSKDQFRELLAYSRELGLEPIPLLQTIGHGEYVMLHAKYHSFREVSDHSACYCVSKPEVRTFLIHWIAEIRELFGELRYFHLGGDEARRFGSCPTCVARDRLELYGEHINELAKGLLADGIRPGIWGDMIIVETSRLASISHDFVIWDWNYWDGVETPPTVLVRGQGYFSREQITPELIQRFPELLDATGSLNAFYTARFFKKHGYDIILCSAARSVDDGPLSPKTKAHATNIAGAERVTQQEGLMGHCVTSWSIRLNPIHAGFPLMALPAVIMASPEGGLETWRQTISLEYFGFKGGMDAADLISQCDARLRAFSAIQWTGQKDGLPAPKDYLAQKIKEWTAKDQPWWLDRETMITDMRHSTTKGMAMLKPYAAAWPIATLWIQAAQLQLDYLDLLQAIFVQNTDRVSQAQPLQRFRANLEVFYGCEQAPLSAAKNAALIVDPLQDYLEYK